MISSDVHQFLSQYIDSAELLDILMLLHGQPAEVWTPENVSNRVFTVPQAAERRLEELHSRGLIIDAPGQQGAFMVKTSDQKLNAVLAELRKAYVASRADVVNAVFKMKADPLKSFSNAFKFRGDS